MPPLNKGFQKKLKRFSDYTNSNPQAKAGAQFEQKVMKWLRTNGWHPNRRTFSWGVWFCPECGNNVSRQTLKCPRCTSKGVTPLHASLDITAFKEGVYLMITCKSSKQGRTSYLTDPLWQNMKPLAHLYGAIPVFAGNDGDGKLYFTNLVTLRPFSNGFFPHPSKHIAQELTPMQSDKYKHPSTKAAADPNEVERMKKELWKIVDDANAALEAGIELSNKERVDLMGVKVGALNQINKYVGSAGIAADKDDFASKLAELNKKYPTLPQTTATEEKNA